MRKYIGTIIVTISIVCTHTVSAQDKDIAFAANVLLGELQLEVQVCPSKTSDNRLGIVRSEKELSIFIILAGGGNYPTHTFRLKSDLKIVSANFKSDTKNIVIVVLSNGTIVPIRFIGTDWVDGTPITPNVDLSNSTKIVGDALYILKQGKIYASRDTAKTWKIDTTNISTETVADIAVDTNYNAWIVTQGKKLFYQHADSNIWRQNTSIVLTSFGYAVFVDRKGRIFVSSAFGDVQMSINGGTSWTNISSGISETITSFGDDSFGNIYAVGQTSKAYRLSNVTPPWISIGDSIKAQEYIPSNTKIINSLTGDSILYAATRYGMFQSKDFGTNWVQSPSKLQSRTYNFYSPIIRAKNYFLTSNNLGIYRVVAGDTIWEKVFPKQGFIWGINALATDSAGNVYGNFPIKTGTSTSLFFTVRSTDQGTTWLLDTAGQKSLGLTAGTQSFDYWVDRQGIQYLGGSGVLYTKNTGQSWKIDTVGLGMTAGQYIRQISKNNKKGIVYVSRNKNGKFTIYSRSSGTTVWQTINTDTLASSDAIMQSDHVGNIILKSFTTAKIWRYDGSKWSSVPLPSQVVSPNPEWITVDNNGLIWSSFIGSGSPINKGVYFTSDNGTTWKYVGLLGSAVRFLTSEIDTVLGKTNRSTEGQSILDSKAYVIAVCWIDGAYTFTTTSIPTEIRVTPPAIATTFELFQNYPNPFNPTTVISYQIPVANHVSLKIYDVLGREVASLVNEVKDAGSHSTFFDATKLSSGMYFARLLSGDKTQLKKMLMIK